jgi:hypothetical protein
MFGVGQLGPDRIALNRGVWGAGTMAGRVFPCDLQSYGPPQCTRDKVRLLDQSSGLPVEGRDLVFPLHTQRLSRLP